MSDKIELDVELIPSNVEASLASVQKLTKEMLGKSWIEAAKDTKVKSAWEGTIGGWLSKAMASFSGSKIGTFLGGLASGTVGTAASQAAFGITHGKAADAVKSAMPSSFSSAGKAALAMASGGVSAANEAIMSIFNKMMETVGAANPAMMEQFTNVLHDMSGVIGQTLTPVLEALIPWYREFADLLLTILPSQQEMTQIMKEFDPLLQEFKDLLVDLAPALQVIVKAIVDLLVLFVKVEAFLTMGLGKLISFLLSPLASASGKERKPLASSLGAGHRAAEYVGVEELGRELYKSAAGGTGNPYAQLETNTERTANAAERTANALNRLADNTPPQVNPGLAQ